MVYLRGDKELIFDIDEMFGKLYHYQNLVKNSFETSYIPFRYAFWIESSTWLIVPSDQGPDERSICTSQVPVIFASVNSLALNSGGGNRKGMRLLCFWKRWVEAATNYKYICVPSAAAGGSNCQLKTKSNFQSFRHTERQSVDTSHAQSDLLSPDQHHA